MKIWLDDVRKAPEGWVWLDRSQSVIDLIEHNLVEVTDISLDFDLGYDDCGLNVLLWLEAQQFVNKVLPKIYIHSLNPVGHKQMQQVLEKILQNSENNLHT